jgi:dihydrodipicolinate synthase/N-acetylneuraminate lyase
VASKFTYVGVHFADLLDAIVLNPIMKFFVAKNLLVSAMQLGAHGSCSSLVYTNGSYILRMHQLARTGNWEKALAMQKRISLFVSSLDALLTSLGEGGIDPVADKGLAVAAGGIVGHQRTRPPYIGWSDATVHAVRNWMEGQFPEFVA